MKSSLRKIYSPRHDLVDCYGIYVSQMTTTCSVCHNHNLFLSSFTTYHRCVKRVPRHVSHVEKEMLTKPEHIRSHLALIGVGVSGLMVSCGVFCISLFVLLSFFLLAMEQSFLLRFVVSDYLVVYM